MIWGTCSALFIEKRGTWRLATREGDSGKVERARSPETPTPRSPTPRSPTPRSPTTPTPSPRSPLLPPSPPLPLLPLKLSPTYSNSSLSLVLVSHRYSALIPTQPSHSQPAVDASNGQTDPLPHARLR
jgi:hypothetical protein